MSVAGKVTPHSAESREAHWYWLGDTPVIYTHWRVSGAKPSMVLFAELRAEEWDEKRKYQRIEPSCSEEDCINPWHWSLSEDWKQKVTLREAMRLDMGGEPMYPDRPAMGTVREAALMTYVRVVANGDLVSTGVIRDDGSVDARKARASGDDLVLFDMDVRFIAELQKLTMADPLMPLDEARKELAELKAERADGGNAGVRSLARRIAEARGTEEPTKTRVRPRPGRR